MTLENNESIGKSNISKKDDLDIKYMNWNDLIIFDTESTNYQPNDNYGLLTQISGIRVQSGEVVATFNELINPEVKIPKKIIDLTGITDEMVKDKKTYEEILGKFYVFCLGCPILIMHNAGHDLRFINYFGEKLGLRWDLPHFDTVKLARKLVTGTDKKFGLDVLAKHFGIENNNHHQADNDALVTYQIFEKLRLLAVEKNLINSELDPETSYPGKQLSLGAFKRCSLTTSILWSPKSTEGDSSKYFLFANFATPDGKEFCCLAYNYVKKKWVVKQTSFPITHWKQIQILTEKLLFQRYQAKSMDEIKTILLK